MKKKGEIYQIQGEYTAALASFLAAEKLIPQDPYLQNSIGLAYMGKKKNALAVAAFQKALTLKPDYTQARNNLGAAFLRQRKWNQAIACFKKVLDDLIYPTPHFPLSNIGWVYLGKKDYTKARIYFLKALEHMPGFAAAFTVLPALH